MHQTHAVRHRQYTFEEKSRRSFGPDRKTNNMWNSKRVKKTQRIHVNREQKTLTIKKKQKHEIMCEYYEHFTA